MNKPKEEIKIIKVLLRDVQEQMKQAEKDIYKNISEINDKIIELEKQNEKPKENN